MLGVGRTKPARDFASLIARATISSTCSLHLQKFARYLPFSVNFVESAAEDATAKTFRANSSGEKGGKYSAADPQISLCTAKSEATIGNPLAIASTKGWAKVSV